MTGRSDEFARISRYLAPLTEGFPGAFGLTDDAAIIGPMSDRDIVATTDTMVAGVHFMSDERPDLIAAKLLRVNLSDLAAMGAAPLAYLLNIALPASIDDDWLGAFVRGLAADQAAFGITLAGGDSVTTPGPPTFTVTALGTVKCGWAIRRSGARPDDIVYVSGTIGDAAVGLECLQREVAGLTPETRDELIGRYRLPRPRVGLGGRLVGLASAAIDISDGLAADLTHILDASGVGAELNAAALPLSEALKAVLAREPDILTTVLAGGDDYELLFTVAPGYAARIVKIATDLSLPLTPIGRIVTEPKLRIVAPDGAELKLARKGWVHGRKDSE
ncbi:MAG: thiamine-phosphate kinase [Rhodospirillales bacterium]|nr:MAG: thiamine-phosphate kinase [Rhodospirillales bacterium]